MFLEVFSKLSVSVITWQPAATRTPFILHVHCLPDVPALADDCLPQHLEADTLAPQYFRSRCRPAYHRRAPGRPRIPAPVAPPRLRQQPRMRAGRGRLRAAARPWRRRSEPGPARPGRGEGPRGARGGRRERSAASGRQRSKGSCYYFPVRGGVCCYTVLFKAGRSKTFDFVARER